MNQNLKHIQLKAKNTVNRFTVRAMRLSMHAWTICVARYTVTGGGVV